MNYTIALFGEAQKGKFCFPYEIKHISQLFEHLGNPPKDSLGIYFAIQSLLYDRRLIFFRVKEEGFSRDDYLKGFNYLKNPDKVSKLSAIGLPNVGDHVIIDATYSINILHKSLVMISEKDLYDYLTSSRG